MVAIIVSDSSALTPAECVFSAMIRSYVGSPAYHAMMDSSSSRPLGPCSEREFYLALRYFPHRFAALHEELVTLLTAAYFRSLRILTRSSEVSPSPLCQSLGSLAHHTLPLVQRALGSQARATLHRTLHSLSSYQTYYQRALLKFTASSVRTPRREIPPSPERDPVIPVIPLPVTPLPRSSSELPLPVPQCSSIPISSPLSRMTILPPLSLTDPLADLARVIRPLPDFSIRKTLLLRPLRSPS